MGHLYRLIVNNLGEEEKIKINGRVIYINCPFRKSRKIFSFGKWRFRKRTFIKKINQYNITCVDWFEYSTQNILYYLLLNNLNKYDGACFELAGFSPSTAVHIKQFLLELKPHLDNKIVIVVVEKNSMDDDIFSEFPIYNSTE